MDPALQVMTSDAKALFTGGSWLGAGVCSKTIRGRNRPLQAVLDRRRVPSRGWISFPECFLALHAQFLRPSPPLWNQPRFRRRDHGRPQALILLSSNSVPSRLRPLVRHPLVRNRRHERRPVPVEVR